MLEMTPDYAAALAAAEYTATLRPPIVVGVDPSLTGTGIASSNGWCDVIGYKKPNSKAPGITQLPHAERLAAMRDLLALVTTTIGYPDLAVMELPAVSRSGGGAHERGWFWWQIYHHLTTNEVPIGLMAPNARALYATGKGNAPKGAVVDAIARRYPDWTTEGNDNAADAVALMAAGRDHLGHPLTPVPKTHRAALDKATWPTLLGATT